MRPRVVTVLGILVSLFVIPPAFAEAPGADTQGLTGHWWLDQPTGARHTFVRSWTDGYVSAWLSAQARLIVLAEEARDAFPPDRNLAAAILVSVTVLHEASPDYRKPPAYYADQVTTFFATYSDLRDRPIGLVLRGLDGRSSMTIEEIARWLRGNWAD